MQNCECNIAYAKAQRYNIESKFNSEFSPILITYNEWGNESVSEWISEKEG
jgi:hypothetical protein